MPGIAEWKFLSFSSVLSHPRDRRAVTIQLQPKAPYLFTEDVHHALAGMDINSIDSSPSMTGD